MASDYSHRRGGHPDLLLWRTDSPEGNACGEGMGGDILKGAAKKAVFVEVKSPNDRLSEKQRIWLKVLAEIGASAAVCHVVHAGSRTETAHIHATS